MATARQPRAGRRSQYSTSRAAFRHIGHRAQLVDTAPECRAPVPTSGQAFHIPNSPPPQTTTSLPFPRPLQQSWRRRVRSAPQLSNVCPPRRPAKIAVYVRRRGWWILRSSGSKWANARTWQGVGCRRWPTPVVGGSGQHHATSYDKNLIFISSAALCGSAQPTKAEVGQTGLQVGGVGALGPVAWKPNSVDWPAASLPL